MASTKQYQAFATAAKGEIEKIEAAKSDSIHAKKRAGYTLFFARR